MALKIHLSTALWMVVTQTRRVVKGFIEQLTAHCEKSAGKIASIVGRFYAMDRDKRWERVKEAYDLLVEGKGKQATDMVQAMQDHTMKVYR